MVRQRRGGFFKSKWYFAIMALWAVVMLFVVLQYRALENSNRSVTALQDSVIHLRNTLYFREPYRTNRSSDLALNIQQVYSLRRQLELDWQGRWLQPDMSQLLYVTDRFIELTQSFVAIELSLSDFVERLNQSRDSYVSQPDIQLRYWQIGSYVLQALYTEGQQSPQLYRTFDHILQYSYQLPEQERNELQRTLTSVSSLLSKYAESDNQVTKLLEHQVHDEVTLVAIKLQQDFKWLTILAMASSVTALVLVVWLLRREQQLLPESDALSAKHEQGHNPVPQTKVMAAENSAPVFSAVAGDNAGLIEPQVLSSEVDMPAMLNALDNDQASVYLLLEVFVEDHQHDAQQISQLLVSDREAAERKVHSLKGVASSLGAKGLKEIATDIELKLKQGGTPSGGELQSLAKQLQQTLASARHWLSLQVDG